MASSLCEALPWPFPVLFFLLENERICFVLLQLLLLPPPLLTMGLPTHLILCTLLFALRCLADALTSGTAFTARYWDCCKPSCGWKGKADVVTPVLSCDTSNNPLTDFNAGTGCNGGRAYSCSNQSPWAVNSSFSYGFVGAYINGGSESTWCCACYKLQFLSGNLTGKTMIVQATNTDYDIPSDNLFTFGV